MASKTKMTVNLSKYQYDWVKNQPRDFNFSKLIRQLLDSEIGFGDETNDKTNIE